MQKFLGWKGKGNVDCIATYYGGFDFISNNSNTMNTSSSLFVKACTHISKAALQARDFGGRGHSRSLGSPEIYVV